jgi:flavodoxin
MVYYPRSGTTRKIAEALSDALTCDLEEIVEDTHLHRPDIPALLRIDRGFGMRWHIPARVISTSDRM